MYRNHFGLSDSPFKITPHTEVFFEGAQRGAILDALVYAVTQGEGLIKVTGEVGTGKTMLCRMLAERLPDTVETIYLAIPSLTRDEMLAAIAEDLGLEVQEADSGAASRRRFDAPHLLRALQSKLIELHEAGRRVVVLIDEAHAMPLESLEEIRLLSNLETNSSKLLQIVLFGQPELDAHLALKHMRQLKERITQSFKLQPLSESEVQQYLNFRLRAAGYRGPELFDARCIRLLTRASQGLSRRINIIADKSLLAAFADNTHDIEPSHVKAAIRDSEFAPPRSAYRNTIWISASCALLGLILGVILTWVLDRNQTTQSAEASRAASPQVTARNVDSDELAAPAQDDTQQQPAANTSVKHAAATSTAPAVDAATPVVAAPTAQAAEPPVDQRSIAQIAAVETSSPPPPAAEPAAAQDSNTSLWQQSRAWMGAQPAGHWVIQLMLSNHTDEELRSAFLARARDALGGDKLHQYPLQLSGTKKIGVLYGPFADRQAAQQALAALPSDLRQYQPYMRTLGVVRQEVTYN